jgi:hypothetical protein
MLITPNKPTKLTVPFAFLTDNAVQLGAQQLRRRLVKLPRPPRRHHDTSPIKDSLSRGIEPRWPLRRTQQQLHRRKRRSRLSCLHTIGATARGPRRPEVILLFWDLRTRDTGDMRRMVGLRAVTTTR